MATLLEQVEPSADLRPAIAGRNPWALAARRLRRNRIALAGLGLFLLIVVLSLAHGPVNVMDTALLRHMTETSASVDYWKDEA